MGQNSTLTSDHKADRSLLMPLRYRSYRALYVGQAISGLGNGMYRVTLAWSVYASTGSALDMSAVLIANVVPQLALLVFGGVVADRVSRRTILLLSNTLCGLITLGLAGAEILHDAGAAEFVGGSFLLGVATAFFGPAYSSIFQQILPPEALRAGNALTNLTGSLNRLVSPAVGGAVYALGGASLGFGLDAVSFFAAAASLLIVQLPPGTRPAGGKVLADIRDGLRYVFQTSWVLGIIAIALIMNTFGIAPLQVLLALVVRQDHGASWFLGLALSLQTGTSALGSFAVGKYGGRIQPGVAFYVLAGVLSAGVLVVGLGGGLVTVLAGVILVGAGFTFNVIADTVFQKYVSGEYLGRVYSLDSFASYSLLPVGYALAGAGAARVGPTPVLFTGGLLGLACCGVTFLFLRRRQSSAVLDQAL